MYYRVKALSETGVRIHLHCYTYGRKASPELETLCEEVHYYRRETLPHHLLSHRPYIVSSRRSRALLRRLDNDSHPILLEGLHNGWLLERLSGRCILLRAHNIEHEYYAKLAKVEKRPLRRLYLNMDARKLKRYESILPRATHVLAITEADALHFKQIGCNNVTVVPAFHAMQVVTAQPGMGQYALYHGDLSVAENIDAVQLLANQVFANSGYQLIVAGRNPHHSLFRLPNVTVKPNPSDTEMQQLIADSQVIVLYTQQATGLKLKLLQSLFNGRHVLANSLMVAGTTLASACHIADTPAEMQTALNRLMAQPFTHSDLQTRIRILGTQYSNHTNAQTIRNLILL